MSATSTFARFDDSPANWKGPELAAQPERWMVNLSRAELDDLDAVIQRHGKRTDDLTNLRPEDLHLPVLGERLESVREQLLNGVGLALLRGFEVQNYSLREAATAYWAVALHLGSPVSQNAGGHVLGHVRDLGFDASKPSGRGYQTAEKLSFHADWGDVVGLLSIRTSKSGGLSSAVSSTALYHAMIDRHPELMPPLLDIVYRDRRDEVPANREPWYRIPVFMPHKDRVFCQYVRSTVRKAQRFPEAPRLTELQEKAFDKMDELAASDEFRLNMEFQPGDMQFLCNHWILHSRTSFEDWPELEKRRHLLRVWLACPGGPEMPSYYDEHQPLSLTGRPQGIRCPGVELSAPLEAVDGGAGDSAKRLREQNARKGAALA